MRTQSDKPSVQVQTNTGNMLPSSVGHFFKMFEVRSEIHWTHVGYVVRISVEMLEFGSESHWENDSGIVGTQ